MSDAAHIDDDKVEEALPAVQGTGSRVSRARLQAGATVAPIVPTTIEETFRLAQAIVKAGLAPASYEISKVDKRADPQKIVIGIMKGAEIGLPPITALSTIAIINKRPCLWGDGAVALAQQSGNVEKVQQRFEGKAFEDDYTAVYSIWRKDQDEPYVGRFSVADAKRANLWNNPRRDPWMKYPQRMLLARARAFALRDGFADSLMGLSIAEEMQDVPAAKDDTPSDTSFLDGDAPEPLEARPVEMQASEHQSEEIPEQAGPARTAT